MQNRTIDIDNLMNYGEIPSGAILLEEEFLFSKCKDPVTRDIIKLMLFYRDVDRKTITLVVRILQNHQGKRITIGVGLPLLSKLMAAAEHAKGGMTISEAMHALISNAGMSKSTAYRYAKILLDQYEECAKAYGVKNG